MNKDHDVHELEKRFAVLEERMNTHESRIDSTLNAMRTDIERGQNALRTDIERGHTEAAKRETRLIITIAGLIVGGIAILGLVLK